MFNGEFKKFIYEYIQKRSDEILLTIPIIIVLFIAGLVLYSNDQRKIGEVDYNIKKFIGRNTYEIKEYREDTNTISILIDKRVK